MTTQFEGSTSPAPRAGAKFNAASSAAVSDSPRFTPVRPSAFRTTPQDGRPVTAKAARMQSTSADRKGLVSAPTDQMLGFCLSMAGHLNMNVQYKAVI